MWCVASHGNINETGELLVDFCLSQDLVYGETIPQVKIVKSTRKEELTFRCDEPQGSQNQR